MEMYIRVLRKIFKEAPFKYLKFKYFIILILNIQNGFTKFELISEARPKFKKRQISTCLRTSSPNDNLNR